jgi:hypothetical protein
MLETAYLLSDQLSLIPPCGTNYLFSLDALGDTSPGVGVQLLTSVQSMLQSLVPATDSGGEPLTYQVRYRICVSVVMNNCPNLDRRELAQEQ